MPSPSTTLWIAIACAAIATVAVLVVAVGTWRQWQRTRDTRNAALALIDVHRARVDATIDQVADQAGHVMGSSAELTEAIARLRADADQLGWLARRVPEARVELRRALLDLLLPTKAQRDDRTEST